MISLIGLVKVPPPVPTRREDKAMENLLMIPKISSSGKIIITARILKKS